jgi:hypothetical protein
MKTPRLPAAAVWLLAAFKVTDSNPALIGDLDEECSGGRSGVWLWRQVLAAIVFAVGKEIYGHKLLTIRAVVVGEAAVWFSSKVLTGVLLSLVFRLFLRSWFYWIGWILFPIPLGSIGASMGAVMFAGWMVGRFHREHRTTLVLLFAMLQFFLMTPEVSRVLVNSIEQPRFRPYLAADMAFLFLGPIAVLLGGYLSRGGARSRDENRSSGSGLQGNTA